MSYVRQTTGTPPPLRSLPQRGQQHTTAAQMNGIAESPPPPPPLTPSAQQQSQPLQQRPSPLTLTTLPQVLSALSSLESEEAELSNSLSALLSDQEPIQNALARLQSLLPRVDELHTEASALSRKVSVTARTAERVGGRVRTLDEEMRRVREASDRLQQVMELKVRPLFLLFLFCAGFLCPPFFFGCVCSVKPGSHVHFLRVLVIIVRSSVVYRCAGLGVSYTTLCAGHGPARSRDQWRFCRDRRRKAIPPFLGLSLIALTLQMVAFVGESLASSTDTAGCADASPSGFYASVHRSNQGSGCSCHDALFQAVPSNWLGNRRIGGVCIVHRGSGEGTAPCVCAKYVPPRFFVIYRLSQRLNHYSVFRIVLHYRFDSAL